MEMLTFFPPSLLNICFTLGHLIAVRLMIMIEAFIMIGYIYNANETRLDFQSESREWVGLFSAGLPQP